MSYWRRIVCLFIIILNKFLSSLQKKRSVSTYSSPVYLYLERVWVRQAQDLSHTFIFPILMRHKSVSRYLPYSVKIIFIWGTETIDLVVKYLLICLKKYHKINFVNQILALYLHTASAKRRISSVGSEHLPYKQRVTGSNPVFSTKKGDLAQLVQSICLTSRGSLVRIQ